MGSLTRPIIIGRNGQLYYLSMPGLICSGASCSLNTYCFSPNTSLPRALSNIACRQYAVKMKLRVINIVSKLTDCLHCIQPYRWYVELLVHPEAIANKTGFDGLSPKILFYKSVKVLKPSMI